MPEGWLEQEPTHVAAPGESKPAGWNDAEDGAWTPRQVGGGRLPGCSGPAAPSARRRGAGGRARASWLSAAVAGPFMPLF
jgi:hypothetical protein